jgi:aspartate aminotransferase
MKLSSRAQSIPESGTFKVKRQADELRAKGKDVIGLGPGEPDFNTFPAVCEAGQRAIRDGHTRYPPSAGVKELREAIAAHYNKKHGCKLSFQNVFVSVGGKGALYHNFLGLLDRGDEVIVPAPYWVSYPPQVELAEGKSVVVSTEDAGLVLEARHVESALTPRTKAVVVNSPSNPTGRIIPRDNLNALVRLARERGIILVGDECYEVYDYEGTFASLAEHFSEPDALEHILLTHTFSKPYAMTGWRVGYTIGSKELVSAMANLQSHTVSNTATFVQKAAVAALSLPAAELAPIIEGYRKRRDLVVEALQGMPGIETTKPEGAFYVFPSVKGVMKRMGLETSNAFAAKLLDEAHVAVVPGAEFGMDGYVRISYAVPEDRLREAMVRLKKFSGG